MSVLEFEITKIPSIGSKEYVILESLPELRRLCRMYNIPLMHFSESKHCAGKINGTIFNTYFGCMSGMYYTYMEQNEETEGVSS